MGALDDPEATASRRRGDARRTFSAAAFMHLCLARAVLEVAWVPTPSPIPPSPTAIVSGVSPLCMASRSAKGTAVERPIPVCPVAAPKEDSILRPALGCATSAI